jgi:hypothetical protein
MGGDSGRIFWRNVALSNISWPSVMDMMLVLRYAVTSSFGVSTTGRAVRVLLVVLSLPARSSREEWA